MDRPSPELVNCPKCGSRNFAIDASCAECGGAMTVVIGPRPKVRRVNLSTVMAVIAVAAVCLAPIRVEPALSFVLAVFLIPATVRSIWAIEVRRADGRPMTLAQKFEVAKNSFFVTAALVLASSTAFAATCLPLGIAAAVQLQGPRVPTGIIAACCAGLVAALFVLYRMGRRIWTPGD